MLAGHRLVHHLRFVQIFLIFADKVAIHAHPVHFAAIVYLLLADDRNIVFTLTGDGTGITTGADVEVDGHAPLISAFIGVVFPQ